MPDLCAFDYAVVRVVPRVEREEFVNAGAVLFCRERRFLAARINLDEERLLAMAPDVDLESVRVHLGIIPLICEGGVRAGALSHLSQVERFRWLTSPRSTVIQVSPVHGGLCLDPNATLDALAHKACRG